MDLFIKCNTQWRSNGHHHKPKTTIKRKKATRRNNAVAMKEKELSEKNIGMKMK